MRIPAFTKLAFVFFDIIVIFPLFVPLEGVGVVEGFFADVTRVNRFRLRLRRLGIETTRLIMKQTTDVITVGVLSRGVLIIPITSANWQVRLQAVTSPVVIVRFITVSHCMRITLK